MAMKLTARIERAPRVLQTLKKMDPSFNAAIFTDALTEIGLRVQRNAIKEQILSGNGPVHPTKLTHRSGALRDSIRVDRRRAPRSVDVGTDIAYGRRHEFGIAISPRPFLGPALDAIEPMFGKIVIKHWKRASGL